MILQSEIFKIAENEGVPPDTIDKNWVLGHFLAGLYSTDWASSYLIFKGGTCLKKCYFPDYRFSEDLDFTLINSDIVITNKLIQKVCDNVTNKIGIRFQKNKSLQLYGTMIKLDILHKIAYNIISKRVRCQILILLLKN